MTTIDDGLVETTEDFDLELRFDPFLFQPRLGVLLLPNVSTVTILDNDGIYYNYMMMMSYTLNHMHANSIACHMYADIIIGDTVMCSSSIDCSSGDLGTMSIRECCVKNSNGLAFSVTGHDICIVCVGE